MYLLKKENNNFKFEHILGDIKKLLIIDMNYILKYKVSDFYPQIFEIKEYKEKNKVEIDGKIIETKFISQLDVKDNFKILKSDFR